RPPGPRDGGAPLPPPRPAARLGRPRRRPRARDRRRRRPGSPAHAPRLPHREAPAQSRRRPRGDRRRRALGEALRRVRLAGRTREPVADLTRLRVKNLVQLARTLGRQASATDRVRFLAAYLGGTSTRAERRAWTAAVARRARRKDRGRRPAPAPDGPTVTCTVVCQDEEAHMVPCLESVTWCDEIVVVDGGSRDRTAALARRFIDRSTGPSSTTVTATSRTTCTA